jgi:hypothetical protein
MAQVCDSLGVSLSLLLPPSFLISLFSASAVFWSLYYVRFLVVSVSVSLFLFLFLFLFLPLSLSLGLS